MGFGKILKFINAKSSTAFTTEADMLLLCNCLISDISFLDRCCLQNIINKINCGVAYYKNCYGKSNSSSEARYRPARTKLVRQDKGPTGQKLNYATKSAKVLSSMRKLRDTPT